eukprot:11413982-Alexandrium_andersonii.AAC.1
MSTARLPRMSTSRFVQTLRSVDSAVLRLCRCALDGPLARGGRAARRQCRRLASGRSDGRGLAGSAG